MVTKRGKGATAVYEVERVEPQTKDKSFFSTVSNEIAEDLPNEIWKETFYSPLHEVSNLGRIRTDNRLENLRWATDEENTALMLKNRTEITKETTRLINKYGYEKTLEILKQIT